MNSSASKLPFVVIVSIAGLAVGWVLQPFFAAKVTAPVTQVTPRWVPSQSGVSGNGYAASGVDVSKINDRALPAAEMLDVIARIGRLTHPEGFPKWMRELEATTNWEPRKMAISVLIDRWVELAPEQACAFLTGRSGADSDRRGYFKQLFKAWLDRDPNSAVAAFSALPANDSQRRIIIGEAAEILADTDPGRAVEWLLNGNIRENGEGVDDIFTKFARQNPQAAMEAAKRMPNGQIRSIAIIGTLRSMGEADPDLVVGMLLDPSAHFPGLNHYDIESAWDSLWTAWGKSDPGAAAEFLASERAPRIAIDRSQALVEAWAKQDPAGATDWADGFHAPEHENLHSTLVNAIAKTAADTNPEIAIDRALITKSPELAKSGFRGLAARDLTTAMEAYALLEDPALRGAAASGVLGYLRSKEPEKLELYALELLSGQTQAYNDDDDFQEATRTLSEATLTSLLKSWPETTAQWLTGYAMQEIANRDPAMATRLYEQMPVESDARERAIQPIVVKWALRSPVDAAAWLATLPADEATVAGYESIGDAWARVDVDAAQEWLTELEIPDVRDSAALGFSKAIAASAPEAAMRAAALIRNDIVRERALGAALESYLFHDFEGAQTLIEQLPLSGSLHENLSQKIDERRRWNELGNIVAK
ncbi:MAG: hypothetical protein KDN22_22420 [Verrucomicrobiae bacterium]|nr:hypothetical protein [Verrucomicrobiae bacterium]